MGEHAKKQTILSTMTMKMTMSTVAVTMILISKIGLVAEKASYREWACSKVIFREIF
jgi:hypothetical protein